VSYNSLRLCLNIQHSILKRETNYLSPERKSSKLEIPNTKRLTSFGGTNGFYTVRIVAWGVGMWPVADRAPSLNSENGGVAIDERFHYSSWPHRQLLRRGESLFHTLGDAQRHANEAPYNRSIPLGA
jgi:hypothetical protein